MLNRKAEQEWNRKEKENDVTQHEAKIVHAGLIISPDFRKFALFVSPPRIGVGGVCITRFLHVASHLKAGHKLGVRGRER
jgi:hypothetical protein